MAIRIICVSKPSGNNRDPHDAISVLGWENEATGQRSRITRDELYNWIKLEKGVAYVIDGGGNKAFVGTRENIYGTRYVQTYADGKWTDNLLALPNC